MTTEERVRNQKTLIEEVGRYFDKEGFQPIAGRILGLLTVMDKEAFTFDEICAELQISKGSASTALKLLEIRRSVEYFKIPGDRKRYFRAVTADRFSLVNHMEQRISRFREISEKILELKADRDSRVSLFIRDVLDMISFFSAHLEEIRKSGSPGK